MLEGTSTTIYKTMRYHQQRAKRIFGYCYDGKKLENIRYTTKHCKQQLKEPKDERKHWVNLSHYLWNEQFDVMAYHKSTKDFGKMLDNGITDE